MSTAATARFCNAGYLPDKKFEFSALKIRIRDHVLGSQDSSSEKFIVHFKDSFMYSEDMMKTVPSADPPFEYFYTRLPRMEVKREKISQMRFQ